MDIFALAEPAIPPKATREESKNSSCPSLYADPPSTIVTDWTEPLATVTFAVAPLQVEDAGGLLLSNNLILK